MNIECECHKCGNTLEASASVDRNGTIQLDIQPCETCMDKAKDEGYDEGYNVGYEDGKDAGRPV